MLIFRTGCWIPFLSSPVQKMFSELLAFTASHVVSFGKKTKKNGIVDFLFVKI